MITVAVSIYMVAITRKLANTVQPVVNLPTMPEHSGNFEIRRVFGSEDMFQRSEMYPAESHAAVEVENDNIGCFSETIKMAKAALSMNLFALTMLIYFGPVKILAVIYKNCNEFTGECDGFLMWSRVLTPIRLICTVFHVILGIGIIKADQNSS